MEKEELLNNITEYLTDLEKNDEKIHSNYGELIGFFDDANRLLYQVKQLLTNKNKTIMAKKFQQFIDRDRELTNEIHNNLVAFIKDNGGFIDMRDNTHDKDDCWALIYDESEEHYKDYLVNAITTFDDEVCILVTDGTHNILDGEKDELLESGEWVSVRGGMCWINATLVDIADVIEQYV